MPTYLAKPPTPVLQPGHPLAPDLLCLPFMGPGRTIPNLTGNRGIVGALAGSTTWATGPYGPCLNFGGGIGDKVSLGPQPSLQLSRNFSLVVRFKLAIAGFYEAL